MDDATIQRLRPRDNSTSALREAIAAVQAEREAVQRRIADLAASRGQLLLEATTDRLREHEEQVRTTETDLLQIDAIGDALNKRLTEACAAEAAADYRRRFDAAAEAVARFNAAFSSKYLKAARTIAELADLERQARQQIDALRNNGAVPNGMPLPTPVFVGRDPRSLAALLRLPAIEPGEPVWWG